MPNILIVNCDSVAEFWRCISPVGDLFGGVSSFLFRGQRSSSWTAQPGIFRGSVASFLRTRLMVGMMADHPTQTWLEAWLLIRFVEACDIQGLAIPGDSPALRALLGETMLRHGNNNINWPDAPLRPLMALAQHHGVPTRLLDVTSNPFVASYFAASDAVAYHYAQEIPQSELLSERLAIYGFDLRALQAVPDVAPVRVAGSTSPNIRAQAGSFLLLAHHGMRGELYEGEVSVESKLAGAVVPDDTPPFVVKVTLPVPLSVELLDYCRRHSISAASMFPGYDGAARGVREHILEQRFVSRIDRLG